MSEETTDPDTSTEDQIGDLELGPPEVTNEDVPVAGAAIPDLPRAAPQGPRSFPQHYTLLLGSVFVLAASLTVWERGHVFGKTVSGPEMLSGTFLMAMAIYGVIVAILNIAQGRLRGMMSAFVTGAAALYLAILKYSATISQAHFLSRGEIKKLDGIETQQDVWKHWIGQFGPGVWLSFIGGAIIVLVFLKAFFPSKKAAEPAPPPRRRRR